MGPLDRIRWKCNYCGREFAGERAFMNHACREKQRTEELRSSIGLAAYAHYSEWMRLQRHTVPPIETFSESKFYSTFIKFAQHVIKANLPDPADFIRVMVENGKVPPGLWCRDNVYSMYLKAYDAAVTPDRQFMRSIDLLEGMAVDLNVDLPDVFPAIGVETLVNLIHRRRLSFWLLLASSRFKAYLLALPQEEKDRLAGVLNVPAALERFKAEPYLLKEFSAAAKELGL